MKMRRYLPLLLLSEAGAKPLPRESGLEGDGLPKEMEPMHSISITVSNSNSNSSR
jgi:hypothetical protein